MRRVAGVGLALATLAGAIGWLTWGPVAAGAAVLAGLLATAIQVAAVGLIAGMEQVPIRRYMGRWLAGTALRFGGVIVMTAAVLIGPARFPPLPTALGFLGVLVPLMALEMLVVNHAR